MCCFASHAQQGLEPLELGSGFLRTICGRTHSSWTLKESMICAPGNFDVCRVIWNVFLNPSQRLLRRKPAPARKRWTSKRARPERQRKSSFCLTCPHPKYVLWGTCHWHVNYCFRNLEIIRPLVKCRGAILLQLKTHV